MLGEKSDVTEEDLKEMVYLEQVCDPRYLNLRRLTFQVLSEGLRYMVLPNTSRYCTRTYKIPDSDFTIPKGMKVLIPTVRPVFITFVECLQPYVYTSVKLLVPQVLYTLPHPEIHPSYLIHLSTYSTTVLDLLSKLKTHLKNHFFI